MRATPALSLLLAVGLAAPAFGQQSLPARAQKRGVRTRDFVVWPAIFVGAEHDTNLFRLAPEESPVAATMIRVQPGVTVVNRNPRLLSLKFGFLADLRTYLEDNEAIRGQGRYGGEANLDLDLFPRSTFKLGFFDYFRRELDPPNVDLPTTLNLVQNRGGVRFSIRPGGTARRRPLSITFGYENTLIRFDDYARGNQLAHRGFLKAMWMFFPKTALVLKADVARNLYSDEDPFGDTSASTPITATLGLNGLITRKIAAIIEVGWGSSAHDRGSSFSSVIGQLTLTYSPVQSFIASLGYRRNFANSYVGNYYSYHEVELNLQARLWSRLDLNLNSAYMRADYGAFQPNDPNLIVATKNRGDSIVRGQARVSVELARMIGLTAGYNIDFVDSDYEVRNAKSNDRDLGSYTRHVIFGSIDLRY